MFTHTRNLFSWQKLPQCNRMTVTDQKTDNKIIKIEQVIPLFIICVFCSVTVILLHCGSFFHKEEGKEWKKKSAPPYSTGDRGHFKSHMTGPRVHTHASGYTPSLVLVQGHWWFNAAVKYAGGDIVTLVVTGFRCTQRRHPSVRAMDWTQRWSL